MNPVKWGQRDQEERKFKYLLKNLYQNVVSVTSKLVTFCFAHHLPSTQTPTTHTKLLSVELDEML